MNLRAPYLLFLGDAAEQLSAKTANGIAYWRPELCVGQLRLPGCGADLGLPDLDPGEARRRGADTLVVGVANHGGYLPEAWKPALVAALEAGLDVASGLHSRLADDADLRRVAASTGRSLHDVRHPDRAFPVGNARPRSGRRLLTVGTDCCVGKMFTALAIERELRRRGVAADFRATGQTGIFIAGRGVSVDAVVSDFVSGAAEWLSPDAAPDHWDVIEGQGSVLHPSYAGVTLGLVHGSQPDALVLCHDPARPHLDGLSHLPVPSLESAIHAHVEAARVTNPAARCVGVSLNTSTLAVDRARELLEATAKRVGLPCVDPVRTGVEPLVDALLAPAAMVV